MSRVHYFKQGSNERADKQVMGGKGAGLMEMCALGLPVPPGLIYPVGTTVGDMRETLTSDMGPLYAQGCRYFSVRSGAPVSMPGMMDTVLGLDERVKILAAAEQVILSAQSPRALAYKRAHDLPLDMGTAVIVQAMVFGDKDDESGSGVAFTRNPTTGKDGLFGEWLHRATGEQLVAGTKTPRTLASLARKYPGWYAQLSGLAVRLETHFKDMQDIEWTVESGKLWLLQTRTGKRTAQAAVRIALEMAQARIITPPAALARVSPEQVRQLDVRRLPSRLRVEVLARGTGVVAGALTARALDRSGMTDEPATSDAILLTNFTYPVDYPLMQKAAGFITRVGGSTSHAAVVARELGKPCIVGIGSKAMLTSKLSAPVVTMCGASGIVVAGEHETQAMPERVLYERLVRLAREAP